MNPYVEQLENVISAAINSTYKEIPPTEDEFTKQADLMRTGMSMIMPVSDEEYEGIINRLKESLVIQMDVGTYITDRNKFAIKSALC